MPLPVILLLMVKPTKFKSGFYEWKIIWSEEKVEECFGKTDVHNKTIVIYKQDNVQIEKETLFHELLHAALDDKVESIFMFADDQKIDVKEENMVRLISPVMMDILSSNDKLHKFLFGGKNERRSKVNKKD